MTSLGIVETAAVTSLTQPVDSFVVLTAGISLLLLRTVIDERQYHLRSSSQRMLNGAIGLLIILFLLATVLRFVSG